MTLTQSHTSTTQRFPATNILVLYFFLRHFKVRLQPLFFIVCTASCHVMCIMNSLNSNSIKKEARTSQLHLGCLWDTHSTHKDMRNVHTIIIKYPYIYIDTSVKNTHRYNTAIHTLHIGLPIIVGIFTYIHMIYVYTLPYNIHTL
jgi:hypothetical protein